MFFSLFLNHMKEEYSVDAFPSVADLVINSHIAMVWYDSLEVINVYLRFSSTGVSLSVSHVPLPH